MIKKKKNKPKKSLKINNKLKVKKSVLIQSSDF